MSQILQALRRTTVDPSWVGSGAIRWTRAPMLERVTRLSERLDEQPPGAVALLLDNGLAWAAADLAALAANRVCVPLPHFFTAEQRDHALDQAGVSTILIDRPEQANGLDCKRIERLEWGLHIATRRPSKTAALPHGTAKITFTSGTTGRPRGVCLDQKAMEAVARSIVSAVEPARPRRHLCALPLATLLENVAGLYAPLLAGAECVLPSLAELGWGDGSGFDAASFVRTVIREEPESLILVPELLMALVVAAELGFRPPESLRVVAVGGARVSSELLERAEKVHLPVYEGYGLSECASVVTLNRPGAVRPGSTGRPLPHARVEIAADGEVLVSGPRALGYVGEEPLSGCTYSTGDLGSLDEDGYLHVRGRKRSVLITSLGRNVSPEWVEAELTHGGAIAQAAVFGEARPYCVAVIVLRAPKRLNDAIDEIARANQRLPNYARVGGWLLADSPFTPENEQATANRRIRRDRIEPLYTERLDALYRESPGFNERLLHLEEITR